MGTFILTTHLLTGAPYYTSIIKKVVDYNHWQSGAMRQYLYLLLTCL